MNLPAPKAIIFDWDNTLVNTWPIIHTALKSTFIAMGDEPWTLDETKARVSKSMRDSFPALFGDAWPKAAEIYQKEYRANHLTKLEALPLARELLARVRELGIYNVVVSNKKGVTLRQEVEHFGWGQYFNAVVGADDAARDKPYSDPVHMAFDKSGIIPGEHVWFIGDSHVDLECALNTGCTAILYGEDARAHPGYSSTHFQGFPYHAHVLSHAETLKLL